MHPTDPAESLCSSHDAKTEGLGFTRTPAAAGAAAQAVKWRRPASVERNPQALR